MKPPFSKREDAHGGNVPTIKIMNTEGMLEVEDSAAEAAAVAAECAEDLEAIPADDVPEDLREGLPFWAELNPLFDAVATDGAPLPSAPDGGGNRMWGVLGGSMQRFHQGECHTPVRVMGGKGKHINRLLRIVPEHRVYVEPFCGGASLFFAKKIAPVGSILNDNHGEIHNFLYQLKHHPAPLRRMLADGLNHERTYRLCRVVTENPDLFSPLQRAWAWLFACASSYMDHFNIEVDFSVSSNQTKFSRLNDRFNVSAAVVEKIRRAAIMNTDARRVVYRYRHHLGAFLFIDPPYLQDRKPTVVGHYKGAFGWDAQADLLRLLGEPACQAKWLLTCYENRGVRAALEANPGWMCYRVENTNNMCRGVKAPRRYELFVANYDIGALGNDPKARRVQ